MILHLLYEYLAENTSEDIAEFFRSNPEPDIYAMLMLQDIVDLVNKYAEDRGANVGTDEELLEDVHALYPEVLAIANYNTQLVDKGHLDSNKLTSFLASKFVQETYCSSWHVSL